MSDYSVKLILTRDQRRAIDRAAKAAGLKTGPWARSELLKLSQVAQVVQTLRGAPKSAIPPYRQGQAIAIENPLPAAAFTRSFDPDA